MTFFCILDEFWSIKLEKKSRSKTLLSKIIIFQKTICCHQIIPSIIHITMNRCYLIRYPHETHTNLLLQIWDLQSTDGKNLTLRFVAFDLEHNWVCGMGSRYPIYYYYPIPIQIICFCLNVCSSYINNLYPGYQYDVVEIFLGNSSQTYCGDTIPGPFTNISTAMTVKFATNAFYTRSGFLAAVCCDVNVTRVVISCELNWIYNIQFLFIY